MQFLWLDLTKLQGHPHFIFTQSMKFTLFKNLLLLVQICQKYSHFTQILVLENFEARFGTVSLWKWKSWKRVPAVTRTLFLYVLYFCCCSTSGSWWLTGGQCSPFMNAETAETYSALWLRYIKPLPADWTKSMSKYKHTFTLSMNDSANVNTKI